MRYRLMATLLILLMAGSATAEKPLKVVCTLTDLGWFATQIGGPDIEVSVLCPGPYDPHFLPAKPSLARRLGKADLLCYNGMQLEVGWLPVLMDKARNNRIRPGQSGHLDCSEAVEHVLEVPEGEVSRAEGDVHPDGNPHYLLDPRNGLRVARLMTDRFSELRPDATEAFEARYLDLLREMENRISSWYEAAELLRDTPLVQYTKQWEYLAEWLDLEILGSVEHRPGISPSPRHVDELVRNAEVRGVRELIAAPWNHLDVGVKAADRMGASFIVLPAAVEATSGAETYPAMFDTILSLLLNEREG